MAFRANTKTPEERIALAKRMLAKYPPGTLGHERALETLQRFQTNPKKRKTKRTRTPAQKAATARMLAANKAKRAGAKWKAGNRTPAQRSARKRTNTVAGYYPNPRRTVTVRMQTRVEYSMSANGPWTTLATFVSKEKAEQYAKAFMAANPKVYSCKLTPAHIPIHIK